MVFASSGVCGARSTIPFVFIRVHSWFSSASRRYMKPTRNLWPHAIILVFALFISGTVSLVIFACSQKLDLVSADYYEQELKFQRRIDQVDHVGRLSGKASVAYEQA